jgi:hypothetical protein
MVELLCAMSTVGAGERQKRGVDALELITGVTEGGFCEAHASEKCKNFMKYLKDKEITKYASVSPTECSCTATVVQKMVRLATKVKTKRVSPKPHNSMDTSRTTALVLTAIALLTYS